MPIPNKNGIYRILLHTSFQRQSLVQWKHEHQNKHVYLKLHAITLASLTDIFPKMGETWFFY